MLKLYRQFIITSFVCFLVGSAPSFAQIQADDISLLDSELSIFYQRGSYLVYDCFAKHWVCTSVIEHRRCNKDRNFSILENLDRLPCASVKKFEDNFTCLIKQRELVNSNMENRFCMHPRIREQYRTY